MLFNLISTVSIVNGTKTCFYCIIRNIKLIQQRFIKALVFQLGRIRHSGKI